MSKKKQYKFFGTMGDIIDLIRSLPPTPNQGFLKEWNEFVIKTVGEKVLPRELRRQSCKKRL